MGLNTQVQNNEWKPERSIHTQQNETRKKWQETGAIRGKREKETNRESMSIFIWFYWQYIRWQWVIGDELYGWFIYMLHVCVNVSIFPFFCYFCLSNSMHKKRQIGKKKEAVHFVCLCCSKTSRIQLAFRFLSLFSKPVYQFSNCCSIT